uniref:Fluorescent protein n=1 Tax=Cytaeis uchidae TaxID=1254443 RepID=A0A8S0GTI5_9CNID|nr:fluorescent protein [Cytaeis uchidae]
MASTPFKFQLKGTINGRSFSVEGEGEGNSLEGVHKGKYVCTSGKLPMSWAALGTSFGYGMKLFTKYPSGLRNWFQEVMPEGYTCDRQIQYKNDGKIDTKHQLFMKNGILYNIVEFTGQGFKENSPVLTGDMEVSLPNQVQHIPTEDGVECPVTLLYPLKSDPSKHAIVTQNTICKPLGNKVPPKIKYHWVRKNYTQEVDKTETRDHVVQSETLVATDPDPVELPFKCLVNGTVNGKRFVIEGEGIGNLKEGVHKGKYVCTSGKLPMSWAALGPTFGYGIKLFARYPSDLGNLFKDSMPNGYSHERESKFDNDGTIIATHEIFIRNGTVHNNVKLTAANFKEDSPVLNGDIECSLPNYDTHLPIEGGVKCFANLTYPLKSNPRKNVVSKQLTICKPLGGKPASQTTYHWIRIHYTHTRDESDARDHVIQDETLVAEHGSPIEVPFKCKVDGTVNGKPFTIVGEGTGDSSKGVHSGKYVCTSGKLPMSWAALGTTFGYGMKYFTKYPVNLPNMFQEVMPHGYSCDRIIEYQGDGIITSHHELFIKDGVLHNNVKLTAANFKENSPALTGNMDVSHPDQVIHRPIDGGVECPVHLLYPLLSDKTKCVEVYQNTICKPLHNQPAPDVPYHWIRKQYTQSKDATEERDHICQSETLEAHL